MQGQGSGHDGSDSIRIRTSKDKDKDKDIGSAAGVLQTYDGTTGGEKIVPEPRHHGHQPTTTHYIATTISTN